MSFRALIVCAMSSALVLACGLPAGELQTSAAAGGGGGHSTASSSQPGSGGAGASSATDVGGGAGGAGASGTGGGGAPPLNALRARIAIAAGNAGVPAGYSIRVVVDHASLVTSGESVASGDDVRIVHEAGLEEIDRVLGLSTRWNDAATELWFRLVDPIAANTVDDGYFLYYATEGGGPPPADPNKVHVFFDDFESGALGAWSNQGPFGAVATDQARSGSHSLKADPVDQRDEWVIANGVDEADVAVDAFWRISQTGGFDISQGVRASVAPPVQDYELCLVSGDIYAASYVSGVWQDVDQQNDNVGADQWYGVTTIASGTQFKALIDGVQVVPPSGWVDVGGALTSGSVTLRSWKVPAGQALWIDDVRVRKFVDPEPTTTVGAPEAATFPP